MHRLRKFALAALVALTITACDEGTPPVTDVPPPPPSVGTISGTVTIDGTGATGITATLSSGATTATGAGGTFSFAGVEAGSYTVTISGYPADAAFPSATQAATIASDGQTVQLNFAGEYIRSSSVVGSVGAADPMMMGSDSNGELLRPDMLDGITVTLEGEHAMAEPQHTMEGGFAFTGLRAGSYTVTISDTPEDVHFETLSMTVEVELGDVGMADFEGAYIRTASVEGQVVIDGEGLAGVTVTLTGGRGNDNYTKMTGADGEYAFTELRPGDYQVSISGYDADDYEFASSSHDVSVELDETETVSFTGILLRTSGISGRVSVGGMGLKDVTVTLSGADNFAQTEMTDASGQFAIAGLAAGDYTVTISGFDAVEYSFEASRAVTLEMDATAIVNFAGTSLRTASVAVMVTADGEGVAGASATLIQVTGPTSGTVLGIGVTGDDGGYTFGPLLAGAYRVDISVDSDEIDFTTTSWQGLVATGMAAEANFAGTINKSASISGSVTVDGEGMPNVTVTLSGGADDSKETGDDGSYSFSGLRKGEYTVSITNPDENRYAFTSTSESVNLAVGQAQSVSFAGSMVRSSSITGRVGLNDGTGVEGVTVTLSGAASDTDTTDAGGLYAFTGLGAGDYTVAITLSDEDAAKYVFDAESTSKSVTLGDDDPQTVNFNGVHDTSAMISGRLYVDEKPTNDMYDEGEEEPFGPEHRDVSGVGVVLVGPEVNKTEVTVTGSDGEFSFPELQAGTYQVLMVAPGEPVGDGNYRYSGGAAGYEVIVDPGEAETQNLPFVVWRAWTNWTVNLKHGDDPPLGAPLPDATVTLYADAAGANMVGSGTTDADGQVSVSWHPDHANDTVYAAVTSDGYDVATGIQAVMRSPLWTGVDVSNDADIVNLNVDVTVSGATITTEYGGGVELAGWALNVMMAGADGDMVAVTGAPEALGDDGSVSFESAVEFADLPMSYYFAVAEDQDDELDGGESVEPDTAAYVHTGLSLAGPMDVAVEARYATQTLMVYVHHERDQVMGYTGNVLDGDMRVSGMLDVEVRYVAANGRSRAFTKEEWDAEENTKDAKGVLTFSQVPADMNVIVTAKAAGDANVILLGDDRLATYEDFEDNGVTGSAFGDLGGFHHTVALCPLPVSNATVQDPGDCASFAFVNTYTVDGQAWKSQVKMDDDVGFGDATKVGVPGTEVTMDPVAGKNLAGDPDSFTAAEKDDKDTKDIDETKQFDFGQMADGVYKVGVPSGWVATDGASAKLPSEFLLEDELDADDHLNIDVTPTTGFLYGLVEDGEGLPAEGVTVDVNGESAVTDESGRYIVEGFSKRSPPRKPILVTASGTGYTTQKDSLSAAIKTFAANTPTQHDFDVRSIGDVATFSGHVRLSGGGALSGVTITAEDDAGAELKLLNANAKSSSSKKENDIYKTDDDGAYTVQVQAVGAGGSVTLKASMKGRSFSPELGHSVSAAADANISGLDFTAFDHATISGRVLNPDGGPEPGVKITATRVGDSSPADSDISRSTGTYSLSVPYGAYLIAGDPKSGYDLTFKDGIVTVNVAPGQRLAFGDIKATVSEAGRPPRFTSSASFTVAAGEREIGTVKATDPDDKDKDADIVFSVDGGEHSEMMVISTKGVLTWAQTTPPPLKPTAADNVYKATIKAMSGSLPATQDITVTVTASGDLVVKLVVTPATVSEGGTSVVTATLESAASSPFYVVVAAPSVEEPSAYATLSTNKTLFIAEGATSSSGSSVTITAVNDNVYTGTGKQIVMVTGTPSGDDMTVSEATLTITDDDVPFGKVQLILTPSSIKETNDTETDGAGVTENQTVVTAKLVGGIVFDAAVTITVSVEADAGATGQGTLIIPAGEREPATDADDEVTITATGDDADGGNTVVVVSGTATLPGEAAFPDTSQPDPVTLVILDDDAAPSAPTGVSVSVVTTGGFTVSWKAPSNLGTMNGIAGTTGSTDPVVNSNITYQYRFVRTSVANDPTTVDSDWGEWVQNATSPQEVTGTLVAERGYTVQLQTILSAGGETLDSRSVSKTFTVPASS